ncbi:MAG: ATP-binding cassette domain-containing protein, partial [Rhodospirillaceae bacterium]
LGLTAIAHRPPRKVSVGQRQRAAIARALVTRPPLLLADEPTASLDRDTAEEVMALLTHAARERGAALVLVTHDPDLAQRHGLALVGCQPTGPGRSTVEALAG